MKKKAIIIFLFFLTTIVQSTWANEYTFYTKTGWGVGYIAGDTTYRIEFPSGASELEFPMNNPLLGAEVILAAQKNYENYKRDIDRFNLSWFTTIVDDAGKMKDSDWDTSGDLIIYSESDANLRAYIIDLNYVHNFWLFKNASIGPLLGYKWQNFEYVIRNTDQVGYGAYAPGYTTYVSGKTLEYEVKYKIPYLGLNSDIILGDKFLLNLKAGYSPYTEAEDVDDHVLRYKLSEGDCVGDAYLANVSASWEFYPSWLLQIKGEYIDINTEGTQHQRYYAGPYVGWSSDVDDEISSSSWIIFANIQYRF